VPAASDDADRGGARAPVVRRSARPVAERSSGTDSSGATEHGRGIVDLVRCDSSTAEVTRLARGLAIRDFDLSPDGKWAVISVHAGRVSGAQQILFNLLLVRADGDGDPEIRVLAEGVKEAYGVSTSWAPDSSTVALVTAGAVAEGDLLVFDVAGGAARNLTEGFDPSLGRGDHHEARPLWTPDAMALFFASGEDLWRFEAADGSATNLTAEFAPVVRDPVAPSESSVAWTGGTGSVLAPFEDRAGGRSGFARVSLGGEAAEVVWTADARLPRNPRMSCDVARRTGTLLFRAESVTRPTALNTSDSSFESVQELSGPNDWLEAYDLGGVEAISWELGDGRPAGGWLLLPRRLEPGIRPPCVFKVYAGSTPSRSRWNRFGLASDPAADHPALFLGRGLAVFLPDLPIADEEPMRSIHEVLLPAFDALEASGRVDTDRLGVFGHSYGGYTVNSLLVQTDHFRAAVASACVANLVSGYFRDAAQDRGTGWFETGQGRMGVPLFEDVDRYIRNSPVFFVENVRTPLLFTVGTEDWLHLQSIEMFGALSRLGKKAELVEYPAAEHYGGAWTNEQLRDFWGRVLRWFEEHLAGDSTHGEAPSGDTEPSDRPRRRP